MTFNEAVTRVRQRLNKHGSFRHALGAQEPTYVTYLAHVVRHLWEMARDDLVGVYLFGSAAYGGYNLGTSDLDVQAVVERPLTPWQRQRLIAQLWHRVLPCPARRLELVVYTRAAVASPTRPLYFQLNLNTGRDIDLHVSHDPAEEPPHWFLIDVSIGRQCGQTLCGPPPQDVFAAMPQHWVREAVLDCLRWHLREQPQSPSTLLNSYRAWRYLETGEWGSKLEGATWVQHHHATSRLVDADDVRRLLHHLARH